MVSIDIAAVTARNIITGVSGGECALKATVPLLSSHPLESPVILDLGGVEVLAGSALRYLLQGIRRHPQCTRSAVVLANLSEDNLAEAELVAEATRTPFIRSILANGELTDAKLIGPLDDKVAFTFQLVILAGEADAQTVSQMSNETAVVTVWNNRLASLQSMGLLRERKVGKRKFYSPVIGGIAYGG